MADNRMKYTISSGQFPFVEIELEAGESAYVQRGSMVYHTPGVSLNTKLNAKGDGVGKLLNFCQNLAQFTMPHFDGSARFQHHAPTATCA